MIQAEKRWCNQRLGFNLTCNPLFMRLDAIHISAVEGACQCCVVQWGAFASWWPACHGWDVAALVVAVSQWVFRKCSPVTARTACTWAEGTIFVCEAVTWSADPTSGCINNRVFTGTVSVYILWWRACSAGRKTKCLLSAPSLQPFSCLSATFELTCVTWHTLDLQYFINLLFFPAAWPTTGNGVREQRFEQLQFWRHHEQLLSQHDHQGSAPPGERSQNERSDIRNTVWKQNRIQHTNANSLKMNRKRL